MMKRDEAQTGTRAAVGTRAPTFSDRSGVALILVVGLLALMMVMGVAFSVYMRTERVAAGNFKSDVKARQLLYVALNRALQDIESSVWTNSAPPCYPPWAVTNSSGYGDAMAITSGTAISWLPAGPLADGAPLKAEWIDVGPTGEYGRIAYLAVNCSGLLDVNSAGGLTRSSGTNAGEIQIWGASEVNEATLLARRPFSNVQELNSYGVSNGAIKQAAVVLSDFSRCSVDTNAAYVGGPESDWSSPAVIMKAFADSGVDASVVGLVYTNLLDYVDSDSIPKALNCGTVEAVPMISEVIFTYEFTLSASNTWDSALQCEVEWAYPFQTNSTENFDLKATLSLTPLAGDNVNPVLVSNVVQNIGVIPAATPFGTVMVLSDALTRSGGPTPSAEVNFRCDVSLEVRLANGTVCDAMPAGSASPMQFSIQFTPLNNGALKSVTKWMECSDPRFNWNPNAEPWYEGAVVIDSVPSAVPTPNAINNMTTFLFQSDLEDTDRDLNAYVANRPLRSVGELGMLAYSPLKTIRLYSHSWAASGIYLGVSESYHHVLDKFRVVTNTYSTGLINPNSPYQDVLVSAFLNMPMQEWGATAAEQLRLTEAEAENVASNVRSHQVYANLSGMGIIDWSSLVSGGNNELKAESFLRNTAGILSVRQNYFIILLYAQSTKVVAGLSDRSVVAGVRAVAEVWRDPVKNAEGRNPVVVRSFKILSE